ncbi:MAG: tripartite tricarboxylate transporter substrate binding protein [Propionibacteriaceae bacterium]|nr:tripartite tricarboxylate transporter substrate binding protein [Propionibacteriaceae bacterium]
MSTKRWGAAAVAAAAALSLFVGCGGTTDPGPSDEAWTPSGPVRLIIPYAAGGATDTIGRLVADHMSRTLGKPIIVDNVTGSNGTVGTLEAFNSPADGLTILLASGSIQVLIPQTTDIGFDPFEMVFIGSTHESVAGRLVMASSPWQTIEDLVAYGTTPGNPTLMDVTSGGFGVPDIATAMFNKAVGGNLNYRTLPTDGGAEQVTQLLSGNGHMANSSAGAIIEYIKSGEVRPLMIESASWPLLEEMNIPKSIDKYGYKVMNPASMMAPPNLPENIRKAYEDALKLALEEPELQEKFIATNELVRYLNGADARAYAKQGFDDYTPILAEFDMLLKK